VSQASIVAAKPVSQGGKLMLIDDKKLYRWTLANGIVEYNEVSGVLRVDGKQVHLENRPALLLRYLLRRAGEIVTHEQLLNDIWGNRTVENVLPNAVNKLRQALGKVAALKIENVPRQGYRLVGEVHGVLARTEISRDLALSAGQPLPGKPELVLQQLLARNAEGEVWSARNLNTNAPQVVKFASSDARLADLKLQAMQADRLSDRLEERVDLVSCLDTQLLTQPYFVQNAFAGQNLKDWLHSQPTSSRALRLAIAQQMVAAVAAGHSVGILHHGLKPENVLLQAKPDHSWQVSVADFSSERIWRDEALTPI
jgi:eukaryotic-like serine/threonine-protein kinase